MLSIGLIRKIFDEEFEALKSCSARIKGMEAATVHQGYFASKKEKGVETSVDTTGKTKADAAAYDLIMKDKERLLSFDEPVGFIFSHSALREGWDNPNIFQICTLNARRARPITQATGDRTRVAAARGRERRPRARS